MTGWRLGAWVAAVLVTGPAVALVLATLPAPSVRLADHVAAGLADRPGLHDVTAILLDFRGYDTLLEVAVLLAALVGVPAAGLAATPAASSTDTAPLPILARPVVPLMVLLSGYVLWAGSHHAGGAFQAAAVLAAAVVLLHLAGAVPASVADAWWSRAAACAGLVVFVVAAGFLATSGRLLQYPQGPASRSWMVVIEAALAPSLAATLGGLFLAAGRSRPDE